MIENSVRDTSSAIKSYLLYVALWLAALVSPLTLRILLMLEKELNPAIYDLSGFLSDIAISSAIALVLWLISIRFRWVAFFFLLLWSYANYGIYEYIKTLDALPTHVYAQYINDKAFLEGSAFVTSRPLVLGAIIIFSSFLFWMSLKIRRQNLSARLLIFTTVCIFTTSFFLPLSVEIGRWRQTHSIQENLFSLMFPEKESIVSSGIDNVSTKGYFEADLEGKRLVSKASEKTNVVLIILESISSAYLPSLQPQCLQAPTVSMPKLNKIAQQSISFSNFLTPQQGTDRGEYAMLCGDYPKFRFESSKMTDIATGDSNPNCLPNVLNNAGYETVYLQAAPLPFMYKNIFMPKAGFSQVYGDEWFKGKRLESAWGVDDHMFFQQSLEMVKKLDQGQKPFFLTLLTVGTHHPFHVPKDYPKEPGMTEFQSAVSYADMAISAFINELMQLDVAKNTLILITSDESAGFRRQTDSPNGKFSKNLGLMLAFPPEEKPNIIKEAYSLSDVSISILDYLGLESSGTGFIGRSFFKKYDKPRMSLFAGGSGRNVGVLDEEGNISFCSENFNKCISYNRDGQGCLTDSSEAVDPNVIKLASAIVDKSMKAISIDSQLSKPGSMERIYPLITKKELKLNKRPRTLFASQVAMPINSEVEVSMEIRLRSNKGSAIFNHHLSQYFNGEYITFYEKTFTIKPGNRLVLNYVYNTVRPIDVLVSQGMAWLEQESSSNESLEFVKGEIKIRSSRNIGKSGIDMKRLELGYAYKGIDLFDQGIVMMREKQPEKAAEFFKRFLEVNPDHMAAFTNLAFCIMDMKNHEESLRLFEEAVNRWPEYEIALFGLAKSYELAKKNTLALQTWDRYIQVAPESKWKKIAIERRQSLQVMVPL